ncbi:MAG: nicotinate-nucleotide adenylyltransferase [Acidobacteriota bacterium]
MSGLAIFGGTFDPVHLGHLLPARRVCDLFGFTQVLFVPAALPPHKQGESVTPFAHRFAMLALATQDEDRFLISDLELGRAGPSYTFETLRSLRQLSPEEELFFLLGSDSFLEIESWHRWQEIAELAHLVVLHRPGAWGEELRRRSPAALLDRLRPLAAGAGAPIAAPGERLVYLVEHEPVVASATEIRDRLHRGLHLGGLVPRAVERYIRKHRLYHLESEGNGAR